ncbi:MAG: hypothetical protein H6557_12000 [Lewinellaceae bacterium]|nr:hypothetical protein [Phaeodactylibacter sp.]MCB9037332.1 hypothetical protein [Lewinellaceae bacterium]
MKLISALCTSFLYFSTSVLFAQDQLAPERPVGLPPEITNEARYDGPADNLPDSYRCVATTLKRWDYESGDWGLQDSTVYAYDENNNLTEALALAWNGILWSKSLRITNTYNARNQPTSSTDESWDGTNWITQYGNRQTLWEYDEDGNVTQVISRFRGDEAWGESLKSIYVYDPVSSNLSSRAILANLEGSGLENYEQELYPSCNDRGNPLITILQSWENEQWVTVRRESQEYNEDGNCTLLLVQTPDGENWTDKYRNAYTYGPSTLLSGSARENWDKNTRSWALNYKTDYQYNTKGGLTSIDLSYWDKKKASWVGANRQVLEYDEHFNLASSLSQFPQNGQLALVNNHRSVFTSDTLGNLKTEEYQRWLSNKSEWEGDYQRTFYYEAFENTEAIQLVPPSAVSVTQSSADDFLQASVDRAVFPETAFQGCIFSLTGKPLHPFKIASAGRSFNISLKNLNLSYGTYLLQIRQGKRMVMKMIAIVN